MDQDHNAELISSSTFILSNPVHVDSPIHNQGGDLRSQGEGGCLHSQGHSLGLMLCCNHLEILNNFIFELGFCRWSPWANGECVKCAYWPLPAARFYSLWCPVGVEFQWTPHKWSPERLEVSLGLCAMSTLSHRGRLTVLRGHRL